MKKFGTSGLMKRLLCTLLAVVMVLGFCPVFQTEAEAASSVTRTGVSNYTMAYEILDMVNDLREENGLEPLEMEKTLLDIAMLRAAEISYSYSHTRPDGTNWGTAYPLYIFNGSGENIAMGQSSPEEAETAWENSPGHRANILNGKYEYIGIGVFYYNGTYYWAQNFGGPCSEAEEPTITGGKENKTYTINLEVPVNTISITGTYDYDLARGCVEAINEKREAAGLDALTLDDGLCEAARQRAAELVFKFSSARPSEKDPWDLYAGGYRMEWIGKGYSTASHAADEMGAFASGDSIYTAAGIGVFNFNGTNYWMIVYSDITGSDKEKLTGTEEKTVEIDLHQNYYEIQIEGEDSEIQSNETDQFCLKVKVDNSWITVNNDSLLGWKSSDTSVATISSSGLAKGGSFGTTEITCDNIIVNGEHPSFTLTVNRELFDDVSEDNICYFEDVKDTGVYYYKPVYWAADNGITTGRRGGKVFDPNATCTRAEIVTFLWRAAGKPEPKSTENPFSDISSDKYYYKAVLWAYYNGITTGRSGGKTFDPNGICTRREIVTFLWRAAGKPEPSSTGSFTDVTDKNAYFYKAVYWAAEQKITTGKAPDYTTFDPLGLCTRGMAVTFIYRQNK